MPEGAKSLLKQPKNMPELVGLLTAYGAPLEKYGKGPALPLQALLEQVLDNTLKFEDRAGKLIRCVHVAAVNVYYRGQGKTYKLKEDRQYPIDQETKQPIERRMIRRRPAWSIGQKMAVSQSPLKMAVSVVKTELGLKIASGRLLNENQKVNYDNGGRYPGLKSHIRIHEYDLYLLPQEVHSEGYEYQDKYLRSYFSWKPV